MTNDWKNLSNFEGFSEIFDHLIRARLRSSNPEILKTEMSKMRNLKSTDKGVMVLGLAKSGSHLILSILDALGPGLRKVTNHLCRIIYANLKIDD